MNYAELDQDLGAIVARLTPEHIKADSKGLYKYFENKRDEAWSNRLKLDRSAEAATRRGQTLAVGSPLLAVGVIAAAGAAALPAAGAITAGGVGYSVASAILRRIRMTKAERAQNDQQAMLNGAADEVMRDSLRQTTRGGLFTRLYRHVNDAFHRYESQAKRLIDEIDGVPFSGQAHRDAVKAALAKSLTPGLADYLGRHAENKHSAAAHLMSRLHTYVGIDALAAGARAQDAALDVAVFHGYVQAPEQERDFLRALGAELTPYDHQTGCFRVRCDVAAYCELLDYEKSFPMRLEKCTARTVDLALASEAAGNTSVYSQLTDSELNGLREAILFEDANGEGKGDALTRRCVLHAIHKEVNDRWLPAAKHAEAQVPGVDPHVVRPASRNDSGLAFY
ncbi:hypothetical protein [Ralstonia sp. ASV6]|uniref:hypothetical protein n=1 Tax=Ralstonia sp. ASV6 TaxID=2795124 RepID=UPI0018EE05BB|nr:hypothetical protein [Ralstonia sp. ASV6]